MAANRGHNVAATPGSQRQSWVRRYLPAIVAAAALGVLLIGTLLGAVVNGHLRDQAEAKSSNKTVEITIPKVDVKLTPEGTNTPTDTVTSLSGPVDVMFPAALLDQFSPHSAGLSEPQATLVTAGVTLVAALVAYFGIVAQIRGAAQERRREYLREQYDQTVAQATPGAIKLDQMFTMLLAIQKGAERLGLQELVDIIKAETQEAIDQAKAALNDPSSKS